jgi:hypothetical protein
MSQPLTVEFAPFTLADGVAEATLLAASEQLENDFLSRADGYVARMLVRRDARSWSDIVFWQSSAHAAKAMAQASTSEVCSRYFKCMAVETHDPGHDVTLFETVKRYGSVAV